jgi:phosphotransferase system  glucose/maltose/N-acetylglucosamine-specific IIC component
MMQASNSMKISALFWITIIISTLLLLQLFQPILDSWIFGPNESLTAIQASFLAPVALHWALTPAIWYIVHGEGIGLRQCREADYFKIFLL